MELTIIQSKIYDIRGVKVMLDFDLAEMYGVETRVMNQAVKRNLKRFPDDFMFQLTETEWKGISSQFVMTSRAKRPKSAIPFVFTEQGVAMLSGLLNSDVAIEANIRIMRAFVFVRNMLTNPPMDELSELKKEVRELKEYMEEVFTDYNDINEDTRMQLELINESLAELQAQKKLSGKPRNPIGFVKPKENTK
ncbi:MAG: ORF6N domain-containing protein [Bacteroidales bacterium]|nr:ORF6N domain-containing protein [Bacteroidales bacterium]